MIYQHKNFQLDTESKRVVDSNGKELMLTGNAYRMLVFLCANRNATLSQIGEFLDWAKEYTENHLRQYKYKINTIIGENIIDYKNNIYSIVGEIKNANSFNSNNRNTDLLRQDNLQSRKSNQQILPSVKFTKIPAIIAITFLLLSFFDWAYGYYTFLRIITTGALVYYAYHLISIKRQGFWLWAMILVAILFNPFIPVYIRDKSIWGIIDIITAIFLFIFISKEKLDVGKN
jgi:hypothetical protein